MKFHARVTLDAARRWQVVRYSKRTITRSTVTSRQARKFIGRMPAVERRYPVLHCFQHPFTSLTRWNPPGPCPRISCEGITFVYDQTSTITLLHLWACKIYTLLLIELSHLAPRLTVENQPLQNCSFTSGKVCVVCASRCAEWSKIDSR